MENQTFNASIDKTTFCCHIQFNLKLRMFLFQGNVFKVVKDLGCVKKPETVKL